ncbi:MAG: GTPase HflX [Bdellovibrionales bacterium GWA2_49_15]|nr:MAG: GTPase HflX [Bdellovibrionales bacterium GWA2_49_15]HAZ11822.1 GTPase HflX [Bdellovibrionales bacterium]
MNIDHEYQIRAGAHATLVSIVNVKMKGHEDQAETDRSLLELRELLRTLGIKAGEEFIQRKTDIDAGTVMGSGKLLEIAESARAQKSDILVFDFELSAGQARNIKEITGLDVMDRVYVILEIFARHARTREAKLQIEIARLQYLLPRLAGLWAHFSRQRGGVGVRGGEGEQQIELDRRIVRSRIETLKDDLEQVAKSREEQKKKRKNKAVIAALVGYTNAGKSSLLNRLCRVDVVEENKLFATLDPTHRTLNPDTHPPMILIDTVGFISNLPSTLVEGFKTTFESALEADLLLIVCDISDPHYKKHLEVTMQILKELGLDQREYRIIFNKRDKLSSPLMSKIIARAYPGCFVVSSYDNEDVNMLREHICKTFLDKQALYDLFIPYEQGAAMAKVAKNTNVEKAHNHERGIFYRIRIPAFIFDELGLFPYVLMPDDPKMQEWKSVLEGTATKVDG